MHHAPSPWLGCFPTTCGQHLQFNVKRGHISRTSCSRWKHDTIIPFVHAFYAFEFPLFYNHHNHEGNIIVIQSIMGTRQGGPLGGALFILAHFKALCSIANRFPSYVFPSIIDDIISCPSIISSWYEYFQIKLCAIDLSIQPQKCVMWSPSNLPLDFNTPSQFTTPSKGIKVLGVPFNTSLFTSSFIKDALLNDFWHVDLLLIMGDV